MHQQESKHCGGRLSSTPSRRQFIGDLLATASGASTLAGIVPGTIFAQQIPPDDPRLEVGNLSYKVGDVTMTGYMARPRGSGKHPGVVVIHENRGLNAHIQDVTRRFAREGFLAFAPDALSPLGGTPAEDAQATKLLSSISPADHAVRLAEAVPFLAAHPLCTGRVGVVGFCWGGGMVNRLAVLLGPKLHAGVVYYGSQVPAEDVPKIAAPLLFHYASQDERINAGIAAYEAALKANNKTFESYMYEGTQHAFNNDTNPARFNKAAADLAWTRTIAFFRKYLGS